MYARFKQRAQCFCSSLSDNDFDIMYEPITAFINVLGKTEYPTTCAGFFPQNLTDLGLNIQANLPDSCTLDNWRTNGKCSMQLEFTDYQISAGIALMKCPGSKMPQVTFGCSGTGCANFLKICNTDNDCGSLKCKSFYNSRTDQINDIFNHFLKPAKLADDPAPGCFQTSTGATINNDYSTALLTYFANSIWGESGVFSDISLCGADIFQADPTVVIPVSSNQFDSGHGSCLYSNRECNYYSNGYSYYENCTNTPVKPQTTNVTLDNLRTWDGTLGNGDNAFSAPAVPKFQFQKSPTSYTLFNYSCSGEYTILDGTLNGLFNKLMPAAQEVASVFDQMQQCRAGKMLALDQFLTRFGLWNNYLWMYLIDASSSVDQFYLGPGFSDWLSLYGGRSGFPVRVNLPNTCNFDSWDMDGTCDFSYTGFNTLFKMDLTMEVHSKKCSANPDFMDLTLTCTGKDCGSIFGPIKFCSSNVDCSGSSICTDMFSLITSVYNIKDDGNIDSINDALRSSNGLCSASMDTSKDATCRSETNFKQDLQYVFANAANQPLAGSAIPLQVCTIDKSLLDNGQVDSWAQTQFSVQTVNGKTVVTLNNVHDSTGSGSNTTVNTKFGGTSGSSKSPVNFWMIIGLVFALVYFI